MDPGDAKRVARLGDVALVRLLTKEAGQHSADVIEAASAEANRRGLPIDEAFLPSDDEPEGSRFAAADSPIRCPHCGQDRFEAGDVLLNTPGLTFLKLLLSWKLEWLHRRAAALACANCGQIQLFSGRLEVLEDPD